MIYVVIFILLTYITLISSLIIGFNRVTNFSSNYNNSKTNFSIIIPFRNEEDNLVHLLKSISNLKYPKDQFEIILIDDDSTDDSVEIINEFKLQNFKIYINKRKSISPKKDAITLAISKSKFDWIVTTDADCEVPEKWLATLDSFIQKSDFNMICGAVKFKNSTSYLNQFQQLNLMSLIGATIGSFGIGKPLMCNGANLAYKKEIFNSLNGFEGNNNISSGDDVFLLEKMLRSEANKVGYLKSKDFIVQTKPEKTWALFFNQQLRWVSKSGNYKNRITKLAGITVFIMNILLITLLILSFLNEELLRLFGVSLSLKLIFDYILISKAGMFTSIKMNILSYATSAIIYPFFSSFITLVAPFKKFSWKDRTFKK